LFRYSGVFRPSACSRGGFDAASPQSRLPPKYSIVQSIAHWRKMYAPLVII
jgi:hypothetical protein